MSQRDDEALLGSSFLSGVNASYLEQLQARYETDPESVDPEWRRFFDGLDDSREDVVKSAEGASWKRPNWPVLANGELTATLDGNWSAAEGALAGKIKARAEGKAPEGKPVEAKPCRGQALSRPSPPRPHPPPSRTRTCAARRATACAPS